MNSVEAALLNRAGGLLCFLALAGCEAAAETPRTFAEAFPEVRRITLDEAPDDPIVGITALAVAPNGDLIITDHAASKVRIFDPSGALLRTLGGPGEAPGELDGPRWAARGPAGEIRVVQQGSPRITTYWTADSVTVSTLPGHYGSWIAPSRGRWAVGAATRDTRFATLSDSDVAEAPAYGVIPTAVNETPFWIFFAKDRAVVVRNQVWTNNSFFPDMRVFDLDGSEVNVVGSPAPGWIEPTAPPVDRIAQDGDRGRIEAWVRTFTVGAGLTARGDSLVFLQVGRHEPADQEPYFVQPEWVDVYDADGSKRYEELMLTTPILAGAEHLYVLAAQPPVGWVLTVH